MSIQEEYKSKMLEMITVRKNEGNLSSEVDRLLDELDVIWFRMTSEEQYLAKALEYKM